MNPALLPIVRAVDYIESQLDAPLAAPAIALAAGLSVSQLHRVFRAATGETLMDYVRHRRLALAAKALCQTSRTVLDIALDHGFENHETFTRAFQRRFGMSPQQFRREGARDHFLLRRPPLEPEFLALLSQRLSQRPSLEHYPEQRLIGLSTTFYSFGHPEENALRQVEPLWWQAAEHFPRFQPAALMGLIESPEYLGHGEQHRYTAGLIHEATDLPEGWRAHTIPAGRYALFLHRDSHERLPLSYAYLYAVWLPQSGERLANRPELEIYPPDYQQIPTTGIQLALPLE